MKNGVDFDTNSVITALNDGVSVSISELEQGYIEGTDSVVNGELYIDYTTADNKNENIKNVNWIGFNVVSADDGLTVADGKIKVTKDGTVVLSDGISTVTVVISNYEKLVAKELSASGVDIEVIEGSVPAGSEVSYTALDNEKTSELISAYNIEANEDAAMGYTAFDVSIAMPEGEKFTDNGEFAVAIDHEIDIPVNMGEAVFKLYHIHDEQVEEIPVDVVDGKIVFTTPSFSEFVLSYTVDFERDGRLFSIYGDSSYPLNDILAMLGMDVPNDTIVGADFSRPSVLSITQEDGVWVVNSHGAFTTKEMLTVKTVDGSVIYINVADAAQTYNGVEYGDLAELSNNVTVAVNGTNLNNEQARDKTFNLTFNYSMLFGNATAARKYKAGGTYNWVYDLSEMAAQYPEIAEFPNMTGTLRTGRTVLGTYEVRDNKVYLHVNEAVLGDESTRINGSFTINMALDANGTGSEDSTTFKFPGGGTFIVKYKPVEYEGGKKSANPTAAVVYPDQYDNGYFFIDYTAELEEKFDLKSLVFEDVLGPKQELVSGSVKVNGYNTSVTTGGDPATTGQTFSLNVLSALGMSKLPANTKATVTYTTRVKAEDIHAAETTGLKLTNDAGWKIGETTVPGGDTTVTITEKEYNKPQKTIKGESSTNDGGTVVNPNGEKKEIEDGVQAVKATMAMLNADGTYHISYGIAFNEGAVPKVMRLTDEYGEHQTLLLNSFTVTYNGQKYNIPASYIQDNGTSYSIPDLKGAIKAATGSDFAANTNYSINYETSVTAADFDVEITNKAKLIMDKEYPGDDTTITLTSEDFQPGTKRNASSKYIKLANNVDEQTTDWEISITEPKNATTKAQLTDSFDNRLSVISGTFKLSINGTEYDVPDNLVDTTSEQSKFKVDMNAVLAYLKNSSSYNGNAFVTAGVNYVLKFKTKTDVSTVYGQAKSGDQTLRNEADWVFADGGDDSPQDGGEDIVTYTIPPYKPTTKSDTVSGNVAKANGKYGDASYYITGEGPYTINYTITVPAQERDIMSAVLTDTFTTNQTIDWSSFKVDGVPVTAGLIHAETYTEGKAYEADPYNPASKSFTLDLMQAKGISKLPAGTAVTITYTATTNTLDEHILNEANWLFDGDYPDGPHKTDEKIVKPEYQPGSKSVRNENQNKEVPIKDKNGDDAKYYFDWTLTITEPTELSKAVLHDDYSASTDTEDANKNRKPHTLEVSAEHPMIITASNGKSVTITDLSQYASSITTSEGKFDVDMFKLFGMDANNGDKFPANTTFTVKYATYAMGSTIIDKGTYHNGGKWDFDGTIGPENNVPGGEADTTLKTTEYNDGTKEAYYNGQRLYGGSFLADEGTVMDYVATIEQDYDVENLTYKDTWNDSRLILVYPITVEDSDGKVVATYANADAVAAHDATSFTLNLVNNGKLPDGSDFTTGVTYFVRYKLDFKNLVDSEGEFDANIINHGHWYTDGNLPPHDDEHVPDVDPKYPDWKPIDKAVADVKYSNSEATPAVVEKSLEKGDNDIWWSDDYVENEGSFFIDYEATMQEPRALTGLSLTDVTNIPYEYSELCAEPVTLTILDADGNVAKWNQLGVWADPTKASPTNAVFNNANVTLTKTNTAGKLGFTFDVIDYLSKNMGSASNGSLPTSVTIPKNFTVKLNFRVELKNTMDTVEAYKRTNNGTPWHNKITARFNNVHDEEDEVDTTIKTRKKMTKTAEAAETIGELSVGASVDGKDLGFNGRGKKVKYTITVGAEGDTFAEDYKITDTFADVKVQHYLDEEPYTFTVTANGTAVDSPVVTYTHPYNNSSLPVNGFEYTIPAGTVGPVVIVYYVVNATQDEATANNNDSDASNDIWGVQTETNTVRNPEEKEITTTYTVMYDSDHKLEKDFTKWDKATGTATWKVTVKAEKTHKFPAGYKIKEEIFKYYTEEPKDTWTAEDYQTKAVGDMTVDLSKVILIAKRYNNVVLKVGVDYEIVGNSIVFLKDVGELDQDGNYYANQIVITGIRTTIPGYDEQTSLKYYYYNDASIRTDHDSLLDEDDAQNDTDAVALVQKKFGETLIIDDTTVTGGKRIVFIWKVTVTPPKGGNLKGYTITENGSQQHGSGTTTYILNPDGTNKQEIFMSLMEDGIVSVVTDKGNELQSGVDYSDNGLQYGNGLTFNTEITDPVIITLKFTPRDGGGSYDLLSADVYKTANTVTLITPDNDTDKATDEKTNHNSDLTISKSVSNGSDGTLEADGKTYPKLQDRGNGIYEYTVVINEKDASIDGIITFTDLLPEGFELVDWNCDENGNPTIDTKEYYVADDKNFSFSNTDHDIYFHGWLKQGETWQAVNLSSTTYYTWKDTDGNVGHTSSEAWMTPAYERDPATGRIRITFTGFASHRYTQDYPVIKYKVRLTDSEKERLSKLATGEIQYYENAATASTENRTGTATETVVYQYDEALDKRDVTKVPSAEIGEITYEVYVNNDPGETEGTYSPRTLNKGEPLELSDTINTSLELYRQGIKVYKDTGNNGTWEEVPVVKPTQTEAIKNGEGYALTYNSDTRVLSFKLADATHFKVVIPCWAEDPTEDLNGDGEISDAEAHNGWYKNTVTLVGEGRFSDEVDEDHKVYTAGGNVQNLGGTGFSIDKYDEYDITKAMKGATFQLYKVAEFSKEATNTDWPASYVIPERSTWVKVGKPQITDSTGMVSWNNLEYTVPDNTYPSDMYDASLRGQPTGWTKGTGMDSETNGTHVTLYAWEEVGLSSELIQDGYTIGDNAKPHYIILYYTAKSRETIAQELFKENKIETNPSILTWTKNGSECSPELPDADKRKVEAEYIREQKKALSSYNITASFDRYYENANFITVSSSKDGYKWPVPNTDMVKKTVIKLWDDYQDAKGVRPLANQVKVQLFQNGVKYGNPVELKNTTISASNAQYSYTWENLPATDSTGKDYVYTVEEVDVDPNYTATYSDDTFIITNHLVDDSTVSATKVWDDDDNKERKRPQSIFYQIYQMDDDGNVVPFGNEVEVNRSGLVSGWSWTGDSRVEVTGSSNFTAKWAKLPLVDNEDAPTTMYSYFVLETKLKAQDGTIYWLDDETNKFFKHEGNTETGKKTGDPLYIASVTDKDNIYTVTNTAVSSKYGSVELVKKLTGLVGNHNEIDVDGDAATQGMADAKTYYVKLINDEYYAIKATLDTTNSTETLKIYNYEGIQTSEDDFTAFEFSEKVKVRIDGLPLGNYIAQEITSGKVKSMDATDVDMTIKGYEYDARVNGESVTSVMVTPVENTPDGNPPEEPAEAEIINNYIPDKGSFLLNKHVTGLPEGADPTKLSFPVEIYVQGVEPKQYVDTNGSLTTTRIIHNIVPGTPYRIDNVPIGKYDVNEIQDRLPDVTGAATYDETIKPDGVTSEVLAHYSITADGTTRLLEGLAITKNGTRPGQIINHYEPKGSIVVNKLITNQGEPDPKDVGKEFWIGVFDAQDQLVAKKKLTIVVGEDDNAGKYVGTVQFDELPYDTYHVYELTGENGEPVKNDEQLTIDEVTYVVSQPTDEAVVGDDAPVISLTNDQKPQETSYEATKVWANLPESDMTEKTVEFKLYRYLEDGSTLDNNFTPIEVTLDGTPNLPNEIDGANGVFGEEKADWKYEWTKLVKSYTTNEDDGQSGTATTTKHDYVYKVEETKFVYDGVTYNVSANATDGYMVTAEPVPEGKTAHAYWKTTKEQDTFTNTLDETTFTAIKLWEENYIAEAWPENTSITMELTRKKQETDTAIDTSIGTSGVYTLTISKTTGEPTVEVSPALPAGASATITTVDSTDGTKGYTISIVGLEKTWKDMTTTGDYVYLLKEISSAGFNPSYWKSVEGGTTLQEINGADAARNGQTIKNTKYSVSLPSTGGPGTTGLYVVGSILTLLALVLLITKKRTEGQGID